MKSILVLVILIGNLACFSPRVPRSTVPTTYQVGWWGHQDDLEIVKMENKIISSNLGLLNSKSVVEMSISGLLKNKAGEKLFVKEIHVSERIIKFEQNAPHEAEIVITPIIGSDYKNKYKENTSSFTIRQNIVLQSMGWGKNIYHIKCGNFENEIILIQRK